MSIYTLEDLMKATKRTFVCQKTASRTSVANMPFSVFDLVGNPGAGTLNVGNTANGIVPDSSIAGYPIIAPITSKLYLNRIAARSTIACWIDLYDCMFSCGAYTYNADVTLDSQPLFANKTPNNTDYNGLELWLEAVTAFTGNQSIQFLYVDQDGNNSDTGLIATGVAPTIGRMDRMPLASGDGGIKKIRKVTSTVSSAGTFNVHIMRWLWGCRVNWVNQGVTDNLVKVGLNRIFENSALRLIITPDGTITGAPSVQIETAEG